MKERATKNRVYISYGSNMDLEQMAYRCPGARVIGKSTLEGWRLAFMGRPGNAHATILEEEGASTPVLVWAINEAHEAALDRYEGVRGGYYFKHYLPVKVGRKTYKDALVYIMSPNPYNLPTVGYVRGILQGYDSADIQAWPVFQALKTADANKGKELQKV